MPRETVPLENRYHITVFDESGANLPIDNMTRQELNDFREGHLTDDLNYSYEYSRMRTK
jgi:hypothetical protein